MLWEDQPPPPPETQGLTESLTEVNGTALEQNGYILMIYLFQQFISSTIIFKSHRDYMYRLCAKIFYKSIHVCM